MDDVKEYIPIQELSAVALDVAYHKQLGEMKAALIRELKDKGQRNAEDTVDIAISRLAKYDQENNLRFYRATEELIIAVRESIGKFLSEQKEKFVEAEDRVRRESAKNKDNVFYRF